MADESLFREVDEGIHQVRRATVSPNGLEPTVEWSIETTDSRIAAPIRTFGSKEELDMVLAIEGRRIGKLVDSTANLVERIDWDDGHAFPGGTVQLDWFDIDEIEEGDSE